MGRPIEDKARDNETGIEFLGRVGGKFLAPLTAGPQASARNGVIAAILLIVGAWLMVPVTTRAPSANGVEQASTEGRRIGEFYYPTPKQWASLTTAPVSAVVFRSEHLTEGKIEVDEDSATLVFSLYSGSVIQMMD